MKCATPKSNKYYCNKVKTFKHEKNITRLLCKIIFQIGVEYIKSNGGPTFIYIPLET